MLFCLAADYQIVNGRASTSKFTHQTVKHLKSIPQFHFISVGFLTLNTELELSWGCISLFLNTTLSKDICQSQCLFRRSRHRLVNVVHWSEYEDKRVRFLLLSSRSAPYVQRCQVATRIMWRMTLLLISHLNTEHPEIWYPSQVVAPPPQTRP